MSNQVARELDDRSQARERIEVFFGSREQFEHGLKECLANASDEINNNFDNGVVVVKLSDDLKTISVSDTGRGINIEDVNEVGKPYYDIYFRTLFGGTKFDKSPDSKNIGANGCGTCCLNYTSDYFSVESIRNGKKYTVTFENGGILKEPMKIEDCEGHGSTFTFKLDPTIYTNTIYNPESVKAIISKVSGVNNKILYKFIHRNEEMEFHYSSFEEYYISEYGEENKIGLTTKNYKTEYDKEVKQFDEETLTWNTKTVHVIEDTEITCILGIRKEGVNQDGYLNGNYLPLGGTINDGVLEGVAEFTNKYCKDNALYKKTDKGIRSKNLESILSFAVSLSNSIPEFQSQTKLRTEKKLYKTLVKDYIKEKLQIFSLENQASFNKFVETILIFNRANEKASAVLSDVKKRLEKELTAKERIAIKNYMSAINDEGDADLYVVEGGSAGGGVISARLKESQAIFSIKGKSLNVSKKDITKILKNEEIMNLFTLLGCGIEYNGKKAKNMPVFNIDKLRFRYIYLFADSDEDGKAVRTLLVNVFNTLAPELIKQGRVRVVYAPLYIYSTKEKDYYIYDEKDKGELEDKLKNDGVRYTRKRFKGIGSLNSRELHESTMNNPNRPEVVLTLEDAEKTNELLDNWFTDGGLQYRKDSIIKYAKEFKISDLE